MAKDPALVVNGLYKDFVLPTERKSTVKEHLLHFKRSKYEKLHALKDINFEVEKGEFFGIVGRNGSGKSTLLKLIGDIYQPTKGSIQVNGTLTPFIELGIGFNPELTGRDNIYLNGAILGLTRKQIAKIYQEIVDFAELEKFMDQKLKNYSSGMQVRLAFSIAIQAHNDILLIDEVLAVGDANFQRKCFKVFREIKKSNKTVIFVTHDMGSIQEFCDRALMIHDSEVVDIGSPRDIALRYELVNSGTGVEAGQGKLHRPKNSGIHITELKPTIDGKASSMFALNDDITADITIEVKKPVEIQMNLFFISPNGEYLAGINSLNTSKHFVPKAGKHKFSCTIKSGQLAKGEYKMGLAIYTNEDVPVVLDIIDQAYDSYVPQITVAESSTYQDGKFYIRGEWQGLKD